MSSTQFAGHLFYGPLTSGRQVRCTLYSIIEDLLRHELLIAKQTQVADGEVPTAADEEKAMERAYADLAAKLQQAGAQTDSADVDIDALVELLLQLGSIPGVLMVFDNSDTIIRRDPRRTDLQLGLRFIGAFATNDIVTLMDEFVDHSHDRPRIGKPGHNKVSIGRYISEPHFTGVPMFYFNAMWGHSDWDREMLARSIERLMHYPLQPANS